MQRVSVVAGVRVLEQAVLRVEQLPAQQVQPLPGHAAVVQALLAAELDQQSLAELLAAELHHEPVRFFENFVAGDLGIEFAKLLATANFSVLRLMQGV